MRMQREVDLCRYQATGEAVNERLPEGNACCDDANVRVQDHKQGIVERVPGWVGRIGCMRKVDQAQNYQRNSPTEPLMDFG